MNRFWGAALLATTMLAGVRAGGSAYLPTSYRGGYGWRYGRGYQPLTETEKSQAADLRASYVAHNPALVCTPQDLSQRAGE